MWRLTRHIADTMMRLVRCVLRHAACATLQPFVKEQTLSHLQQLRCAELAVIAALLPERGKILEIGAGTGWQAQELTEAGYSVTAVELATDKGGNPLYAANRVFPIIDYDGCHLPFADRSFDIVFSSNVLEHCPHVEPFQNEIHRVLADGGRAIHVLPFASWRFWSIITHFVRRLSRSPHDRIAPPYRHGERGNLLSEHWYFSCCAWWLLFRRCGWTVERIVPNRLFYTGDSVLDSAMSIEVRRFLSWILGSSCFIYILSPPPLKE